jgi:hypothetical protein
MLVLINILSSRQIEQDPFLRFKRYMPYVQVIDMTLLSGLLITAIILIGRVPL